jgi:hypothetical protein
MLLVISGCPLHAQTTIYFDFNSEKIVSDVGGTTEVKNLDKTKKYILKTINFNPFQYSTTPKITATDNLKGIFDIFSGIILKGEVPSVLPVLGGPIVVPTFSDIRKKYIADYEKSVRLYNAVFNEEFACVNIQAKLLASNDLLNSYFAYIKQPAMLRDGDKLPAEISTDEATILKMNGFNNKVGYFVNKQKCQIELAQFEATGTSINIEIKFIARDETSGLDNVDYSHNFPVKSRIKVTFSAGIFVSNNLKEDYYIDDSVAENFILKNEGKGNFLPGVMALAHLNLTQCPNFGVNLGAGIDIDKTPHILVGLSYKIANSSIFLNSGFDLAYIEKLTDKYKVNENYTTKPEVSYRKEFLGGFWIGISYKL